MDALAALVGDVARFADQHWGRAPLYREADVDAVLTIDDVEALLLSGARTPTYRLVRDGERLAPERSARPVRMAGVTITDVADVGRIAEAMADGATLVVQALERTSLPVARLCRALEREISHTVQANAYLTPSGACGLARHHDDHDVIVVQQSGTKTWWVEGLGETTLTPGDVLYMPLGTKHSAQAQTEASLHLTIGVMTRTWASVLRSVIDSVDDLRGPLPLGYADDPAFAKRLDAALRATARALGDVDAAAVAEHETTAARRRRPPLLEGHFAAVLQPAAIGLDTIVVRRNDQPVELAEEEDRVVVKLADRSLAFPAIGRLALERLVTGAPVRVGDLAGVDDESKLVVVRRLARVGLLRVIGPAPSG